VQAQPPKRLAQRDPNGTRCDATPVGLPGDKVSEVGAAEVRCPHHVAQAQRTDQRTVGDDHVAEAKSRRSVGDRLLDVRLLARRGIERIRPDRVEWRQELPLLRV